MNRAMVGVLGVTERLSKEAEQENTSMFFAQLFDRQISRQRAFIDNFTVSPVQATGSGLMGRMSKSRLLKTQETLSRSVEG